VVLSLTMRNSTHPKVCAGLNLCALIAVVFTLGLLPATDANAESDQFFSFSDEPAARRLRHGRSNLGADLGEPEKPKSLSGGTNISWNANADCLNDGLRAVIAEVAAIYGAVTVNSTCRSHGHNAAVGGAAHSYHLTGNAVDFRVHGNVAAAASFLNSRVGGLKHSGDGLFHIDTGPRRPMN
jgi:Peptidase M15